MESKIINPYYSSISNPYNQSNKMSRNNTIDYIELYTNDIAQTKAFYGSCFGWTFKDYGPTYTEFNESGLTGGFEQIDGDVKKGGPLIVLYHEDLEATQAKVESAGGTITKRDSSLLTLLVMSSQCGTKQHNLNPKKYTLTMKTLYTTFCLAILSHYFSAVPWQVAGM